MSRLAFRYPETSPVNLTTPQPVAAHHIILESTVRPVGTNDYDKDLVADQARYLKNLRTQGKDMFEMNETRKVQSAGTILYQTTETYGTSLSIEKIIEKEISLVLKRKHKLLEGFFDVFRKLIEKYFE